MSKKYAFHMAKKEYMLHSYAFLADDGYYISDRENEGEEPMLVVSLIKYKGIPQIRLAIYGKYHKEEPSYFIKDPKEWKEKVWITISIEEAKAIKEFLEEVIKASEFI
jgi:hypothetical protein